MKKNIKFISIALLALSCQSKNDFLFELKSSSETNIEFENNLIFDQDFNVYTYRNFYNGGGVSIGDINNDGLADIYFTSNQSIVDPTPQNGILIMNFHRKFHQL